MSNVNDGIWKYLYYDHLFTLIEHSVEFRHKRRNISKTEQELENEES